jgi:hypothetical protein
MAFGGTIPDFVEDCEKDGGTILCKVLCVLDAKYD